jgi:hypothetical protein
MSKAEPFAHKFFHTLKIISDIDLMIGDLIELYDLEEDREKQKIINFYILTLVFQRHEIEELLKSFFGFPKER